MKQRAFEIGVAIMMFGATAMDSEGVGWIIAAGMVIAGAVIAHVAYTLERVEKAEGNRASHTAATESQLKGEKCTSVK